MVARACDISSCGRERGGGGEIWDTLTCKQRDYSEPSGRPATELMRHSCPNKKFIYLSIYLSIQGDVVVNAHYVYVFHTRPNQRHAKCSFDKMHYSGTPFNGHP